MPAKPPATPLAEPSVHPAADPAVLPSVLSSVPHGTGARRMLAAAAAALAVTAAAPATLAYAAPSATVAPSTVAPGGRVSLNLEGCGTTVGRATSRAFGEVRLTPANGRSNNLTGSATVYGNAGQGTHPVTFECAPGGLRVTVSLTVAPGGARGGMGGSIGSSSTGQIAVGGALAAGALGAGVWVLRRRASA